MGIDDGRRCEGDQHSGGKDLKNNLGTLASPSSGGGADSRASDISRKVDVLNSLLDEIRAHKEARPGDCIEHNRESPGSILNAYREGDIGFDQAVLELTLTESNALRASVHRRALECERAETAEAEVRSLRAAFQWSINALAGYLTVEQLEEILKHLERNAPEALSLVPSEASDFAQLLQVIRRVREHYQSLQKALQTELQRTKDELFGCRERATGLTYALEGVRRANEGLREEMGRLRGGKA